MKKLLTLILALSLLPSIALAQFSVTQGGTGRSSFTGGDFIYANSDAFQRLTGTTSPFFALFSWGRATGTAATTTSFAVSNITSALGLFGADGSLGEYAGTSCTNQFVRVLSALGAATCESVVTEDITDGTIIEPDLSADNSPNDGDVLTYDSTGTNFNWITPNAGTDITADLEEEVTEGSLANDTIVEADLKVVNTPGDEEFFTYESTTGDFEWHTCIEMLGAGLCDGDDATGAGGAYPFTTDTTYATTSSATSTPLWLRGSKFSLFASSTSVFEDSFFQRSTTTEATTTNFAVSSLSSALVKVDAGGSFLEAVLGTDYEDIITAGDALTRTGNDIDFDGGASPGGELGGTWGTPTIDDSLAVTSWNLTTPTLTSFFGTACTGNEFLQDIGDTGAFTCTAATGGSSFGEVFKQNPVGYAAPTSTIAVIVGATTSAALSHALFQVNATGTTGDLIKASSTSGFAGNFLNFVTDAGASLLSFSSGGTLSIEGAIALDANGVNLNTGDGLLSILGVGTGADENILIDLNSTTNEIVISSTSGAATTTFSSLDVEAAGIQIDSAGVFLNSDGDGALTILGTSAGSDENLVINFDDVANTIDFTSDTGVTVLDFNTLNLQTDEVEGTGDTDTQIAFTADAITVTAGGVAAITITEAASDTLTIGNYLPSFTNAPRPTANDGAALGVSGTAWSDLFLASGGVINWNAGASTLTHSTGALTVNGSSATLFGIATATPKWALQVASSTGAQLTLSDPSVLTNSHWSWRNAGGQLFLATSSPSTYATSTNSVLTFRTNSTFATSSVGYIGVGTTSPFASFSIDNEGALVVTERNLATSTTMTVDWRRGNAQLVRLGSSATTINFSGYVAGSRLLLTVCSPGGTAGALTFGTEVLWAGGTAPTQTTAANACDAWSFYATNATSSLKVFGAQTADF